MLTPRLGNSENRCLEGFATQVGEIVHLIPINYAFVVIHIKISWQYDWPHVKLSRLYNVVNTS